MRNLKWIKGVAVFVLAAVYGLGQSGCGNTPSVNEEGTTAYQRPVADTNEDINEDTSAAEDLYVEKIQNLSEDFIMGMDISSVVSEFNSGVAYKDFEGNIIDNIEDFCKFLAESGINYVRVRVWNNPYTSDGCGYGGGNNDVAAAKKIAEGCKAAGIHMLVDFHCSDFWADPGKQKAPKAWEGFSCEQKGTKLSRFITESLQTIDPNYEIVTMVQIGNETNNGFMGETNVENMCRLFSSGAKAVKEYNEDVKVAVHVTEIQKQAFSGWAEKLNAYNVEYDILAASYYPYWHGTLENLKNEFTTVKETYGKDVMVVETSWGYTLDDTDGHGNTLAAGSNDSKPVEEFTPQGQATVLRNIMNAVSEAGGLGVFYWEPAWITVGDITGLTGEERNAQIALNQEKWEKFGSGWASSYATEYDPDDAGVWYGGSSWDNQAMFYADGSPIASMHVWEYVKSDVAGK